MNNFLKHKDTSLQLVTFPSFLFKVDLAWCPCNELPVGNFTLCHLALDLEEVCVLSPKLNNTFDVSKVQSVQTCSHFVVSLET